MRFAFTIILVLASFGGAIASTAWPNEPTGSVEFLDCPFTNSICAPLASVYRGQTNTYATFPGNGQLSPPYALDSYMAANSSSGNGDWANESLPFPKEVFVGAWWSTNADFMGLPNNGNKMFFVRNSGTDGDNSFLVWQGAPGAPKTIKWDFQTSLYRNNHVNGWSGDASGLSGWLEPNVSAAAGTVAAGSGWHRIELYLKSSTTYTSSDGTVRWWLDGKLVGNYTNAVNLTPSGFREFFIRHTWDGQGTEWCTWRDCSKSWHHYWDHLRISFPNGAPDPVLPLAITSPLQTSTRVGSFYTNTLSAANGKAPYGWTVSAGSLPPGLTLNKTTGVLSGTPTTVGRSDFTVKVMDSNVPAKEATRAFTIIVSQSTGIGEKQLAANSSRLSAESRMGRVRFHLPQPGAYALSVYDLAGKKVYEHKASANEQKEIRIEARLKNGIYVAKLAQGYTESTMRFHVIN